jgi:hypothetical protein
MRDGPGPTAPSKVPLDKDKPATLTSRIEPKDTGLAFQALDMLAKTTGVVVHGGLIELSGGRSEQDFIALRLGRDVGIPGAELDTLAKSLLARIDVPQPVVKLTLHRVFFPLGRDLSTFCDMLGEDFGRVTWTQE